MRKADFHAQYNILRNNNLIIQYTYHHTFFKCCTGNTILNKEDFLNMFFIINYTYE